MSANLHSIERKKLELLNYILDRKNMEIAISYRFQSLADVSEVNAIKEGVSTVYIGEKKDGEQNYPCKICDKNGVVGELFHISDSKYKEIQAKGLALLGNILKQKSLQPETGYRFEMLADSRAVNAKAEGNGTVYIGKEEVKGMGYPCRVFDTKGRRTVLFYISAGTANHIEKLIRAEEIKIKELDKEVSEILGKGVAEVVSEFKAELTQLKAFEPNSPKEYQTAIVKIDSYCKAVSTKASEYKEVLDRIYQPMQQKYETVFSDLQAEAEQLINKLANNVAEAEGQEKKAAAEAKAAEAARKKQSHETLGLILRQKVSGYHFQILGSHELGLPNQQEKNTVYVEVNHHDDPQIVNSYRCKIVDKFGKTHCIFSVNTSSQEHVQLQIMVERKNTVDLLKAEFKQIQVDFFEAQKVESSQENIQQFESCIKQLKLYIEKIENADAEVKAELSNMQKEAEVLLDAMHTGQEIIIQFQKFLEQAKMENDIIHQKEFVSRMDVPNIKNEKVKAKVQAILGELTVEATDIATIAAQYRERLDTCRDQDGIDEWGIVFSFAIKSIKNKEVQEALGKIKDDMLKRATAKLEEKFNVQQQKEKREQTQKIEKAGREFDGILKAQESKERHGIIYAGHRFEVLENTTSIDSIKHDSNVVYVWAEINGDVAQYHCKIFDGSGNSKDSFNIKKSDYEKVKRIAAIQKIIAQFREEFNAIKSDVYRTEEKKEEGGVFEQFAQAFSEALSFNTVAAEQIENNKVIENFLARLSTEKKKADTLLRAELTKIEKKTKVLRALLELKKDFDEINNQIALVRRGEREVDSELMEKINVYARKISRELEQCKERLSDSVLTAEERALIEKEQKQLIAIQTVVDKLLFSAGDKWQQKMTMAGYTFKTLSEDGYILKRKEIYISKDGYYEVYPEKASSELDYKLPDCKLPDGLIDRQRFHEQLTDRHFQRAVLNHLADLGKVFYSAQQDWEFVLDNLCQVLNQANDFFKKNASNMTTFHQELEKVGIFYEAGANQGKGIYKLRLDEAANVINYRRYVCNETSLINAALDHKGSAERGRALADLHAKKFQLEEAAFNDLSNIPAEVQVAIDKVSKFYSTSIRALFSGITDEDQIKAEAMLSKQERGSFEHTKGLIKKYEEETKKLSSLEATTSLKSTAEILLSQKRQEVKTIERAMLEITEKKQLLSKKLADKEAEAKKIETEFNAIGEKLKESSENIALLDGQLKEVDVYSESIENHFKIGLKKLITDFVAKNKRFAQLPPSLWTKIFRPAGDEQLAARLAEIISFIDGKRNDIELEEIKGLLSAAIEGFKSDNDKRPFYSKIGERELHALDNFYREFYIFVNDSKAIVQFKKDLLVIRHGDEKIMGISLAQKRELLEQSQAKEVAVSQVHQETEIEKGKIELLDSQFLEHAQKKDNLEEEIESIEKKQENMIKQKKAVEEAIKELADRKLELKSTQNFRHRPLSQYSNSTPSLSRRNSDPIQAIRPASEKSLSSPSTLTMAQDPLSSADGYSMYGLENKAIPTPDSPVIPAKTLLSGSSVGFFSPEATQNSGKPGDQASEDRASDDNSWSSFFLKGVVEPCRSFLKSATDLSTVSGAIQPSNQAKIPSK